MLNRALLFLFALLVAFGCTEPQDTGSELYTGNEVRYDLIGGTFNDRSTSGTIWVRERADKKLEIEVFVQGTGDEHPVHLHFGDIFGDGIIATVLNPVVPIDDNTSTSLTVVDYVINPDPSQPEWFITFKEFTSLDASIRVHQEATGRFKDFVVGATNVGINQNPSGITTETINVTRCNSKLSDN